MLFVKETSTLAGNSVCTSVRMLTLLFVHGHRRVSPHMLVATCHFCHDMSIGGLAGAIPASLGNMITARKIFLNNNSIEGTIPASLGNLSNLRVSTLAASV